jgi:hypothetical protein
LVMWSPLSETADRSVTGRYSCTLNALVIANQLRIGKGGSLFTSGHLYFVMAYKNGEKVVKCEYVNPRPLIEISISS